MDTIAGQTFDDVISVLASLSLFGLSLLKEVDSEATWFGRTGNQRGG